MKQETEVLLSSSSILLPGLPFALFTPSMNYVTSTALRQTQPPASVHLTKYFFRPQIDELSQELLEARELGEAATTEWYKGLEARGRDHALDAARLEQWEAQNMPSYRLELGQSSHQSDSTSPAHSAASTANHSHQLSVQSPHWPGSIQGTPSHLSSTFGKTCPSALALDGHTLLTWSAASPLYVGPTPAMPLKPFALAPGQTTQPELFPQPGSFRPQAQVHTTSHVLHAASRSGNDRVAQKRADRRAEIERRCLELDPPISLSTLVQMEAFNAAIQISMPLNENSWNLLRARLVAERSGIERSDDHLQSEVQYNARGVARSQQLRGQPMSSTDPTLIWIEIEKPLRDKLKGFAEQHISSQWANGMAVNKGSSGRFAADVLQYVKTGYLDLIAKEDKLLVAQSMTIPPDSPLHEGRRLKLEDMRWIFDEIVKPHTERFGKDIFLCSICEATTLKKFSFDAVIQHYAAKHTSSLSRGNAVVYWKADWPLEPPFHPTPDTLWHREADHRFTTTSQYAPSPAWTPFTQSSWMSPMPPGQPNGIYNVQCEEVISSARYAWDVMRGISSLSDNVRLFVIIHHVFVGFASKRFTNKPTLSMFTDCVLHKPVLNPLRDMHGLHCKICHTNVPPGFTVASNEYDLTDLLSHFQKMHVEIGATSPQSTYGRTPATPGGDAGRQDWETDMVQLPSDALIRGLVHVSGMTTAALACIATSFPSLIFEPLPYVEAQPAKSLSFAQHIQTWGHERQALGMPPPAEPQQKPYQSTRARSPLIQYANTYDPRQPIAAMNRKGPRYVEDAAFAPDPFPRNIIYVETSTGPNEAGGRAPRSAPRIPSIGGDVYAESMSDLGYRDVYTDYSTHDGRTPPHRGARSMLVDDMDPDPIPPEHAGQTRNSFDRPVRPLSPERRAAARTTPELDEGTTAAENFLNNFDTHAIDAIGEARASHRSSSIRNYSTGATPVRIRPSNERLHSHELSTRRHTPRTHESPRRHPSGNTSPAAQFDAPGRTPLRAVDALEREAAVVHNQYSPSHGPRALTHYEDQQETWRSRVSRDAHDFAYETGSPSGREPIEVREDHNRRVSYRSPPLPHHHYRRRAPTKPIRYIEILPDGRQRLVEELPSPTYERIEYVRTSSPDDQTTRHMSSYGSAPPSASDQHLYYTDQLSAYPSSAAYDREQ